MGGGRNPSLLWLILGKVETGQPKFRAAPPKRIKTDYSESHYQQKKPAHAKARPVDLVATYNKLRLKGVLPANHPHLPRHHHQ